MGITWKTLLIIVLGVIFIVVILLLIFGFFEPFEPKFNDMLDSLNRAISSLFDVSEWPW